MDLSELQRCVSHLDARAIDSLARALRQAVDSADGELAWWRATLAVDAALRRAGRSREAGMEAHRAALAVVRAATEAGIDEEHRDDVRLVARAASEAARALVLDAEVPTAASAVLEAWDDVLVGQKAAA